MKKLGFGAMRLPVLDKDDPSKVDIELLKKMIDVYMERGFSYFDTAYVYHGGNSERALKAALVDRYPRDSFTITTKLPSAAVKSYEDRDRVFNEQMERLGIDYFDYYWLHCVMNSSLEKAFDKYDCFTWLSEKKAQGLVKHIGFSFHGDAELLDEVLMKHPEMDYVQLQLNYLDWESYDIQSKRCYEVCQKYNKPVIVMEPVKGGALAEDNLSDRINMVFKDYDPSMSVASWGIRFAATLPDVYMVLSGMSTMEQVEDNTNYMQDFVPLTEEEMNMCLKVAEMINAERPIDCTACRYCTEGCPQQIRIPDYFKMYNRLKQTTSQGTIGRMHEQYNEFIKTNTNPSECLECGQCEDACPQHLPIIQYLKDVVEAFE